MNRAMHRAAAPAVAVLSLGLAVSACGGSSSAAPVTLTGAGSSAQQAAMQAWVAANGQKHSNVNVNYTPSGSGAGVTAFKGGSVDFAGSDSALDPAKGEVDAAKQRCGGDVLEVPDYVSPIAVAFTLNGVKNLNLDADTIAKIFAGTITKWNDPAIAALNAGVTLPATAINPVHRSDKSGTTKNFTDYLSKTAPTSWTSPAADTWPLQSGEGASGTSGVVSSLGHDGSIGYADESQAKSLSVVSVKVGDKFVAPSADGAAKALAASPVDSSRGPNDLVVKLDRKTTADGAYPIALVSYLIACPTYPADKATAVKDLLSYIVSTDGQKTAGSKAGSAPLPDSLQGKAAGILGNIKSK